MQTAELFVSYKTYKAWEEFLGDTAKERTHRYEGGYFKTLTVRVGGTKLTIEGPYKRGETN